MKSTFYTCVLLIVLSFQTFGQSKVIWNGKGDATQSVSRSQTIIDGESSAVLEYKFEFAEYSFRVHKGKFSIENKKELTRLISDVKSAINKSGEEGAFEWTTSKYTIKSGGNYSPKKGTFKIFIKEGFCYMDKRNAKKLIKALEPVLEDMI